MASNGRNKAGQAPGTPGGTRTNGSSKLAMDDVENPSVREPEDERDDDLDDDEEARSEESKAPRSVPYARAEKPTGGFFDIYRPGQGGRVRWGTAIATGLFIIWCAVFINEKLSVLERGSWQQAVRVAIPTLIVVAGALAGYWLLTKHRRINDFLIATEGEMKKVNWSTRREVIGSTKVVIFVMIAMAVILFVVDVGLMQFFHVINVLKIGSPLFSGAGS